MRNHFHLQWHVRSATWVCLEGNPFQLYFHYIPIVPSYYCSLMVEYPIIWLHISLDIVVIPAPNIECTPRKLGWVLELFILSGIWGYLILAGWDYPNVNPHSWWLECANFLETIIYHHPYHIIYIGLHIIYICIHTCMCVYTYIYIYIYTVSGITLAAPNPSLPR